MSHISFSCDSGSATNPAHEPFALCVPAGGVWPPHLDNDSVSLGSGSDAELSLVAAGYAVYRLDSSPSFGSHIEDERATQASLGGSEGREGGVMGSPDRGSAALASLSGVASAVVMAPWRLLSRAANGAVQIGVRVSSSVLWHQSLTSPSKQLDRAHTGGDWGRESSRRSSTQPAQNSPRGSFASASANPAAPAACTKASSLNPSSAGASAAGRLQHPSTPRSFPAHSAAQSACRRSVGGGRVGCGSLEGLDIAGKDSPDSSLDQPSSGSTSEIVPCVPATTSTEPSAPFAHTSGRGSGGKLAPGGSPFSQGGFSQDSAPALPFLADAAQQQGVGGGREHEFWVGQGEPVLVPFGAQSDLTPDAVHKAALSIIQVGLGGFGFEGGSGLAQLGITLP